MNTENDNFTTPKRTKRLGLRRSSSTLKNNIKKASVSAAKNSVIEIETSKSADGFPQSDTKINYVHLQQSDSVTTPGTPKNTSFTDLQRLAVSTNCRPYRLALSKKVREKMTKKRLEFYLANEMEKCDAEEKQMELQTEVVVTEQREELLQLIEVARKELTARQEHISKVQELQHAIDVWKVGFSSALHDLQRKIEPRLDIATLLDSLHIPQEMIKYIND